MEKTIIIAAADLKIRIDYLFESSKKYLNDYLITNKTQPDFAITVSHSDLLKENDIYLRSCSFLNRKPEKQTDEYLEICAIHRKISSEFPFYNGVAFHGSVLSVDGNAYMFAAKSETGKSTHAALWRQLLKDRVTMINDDKPFLRITDGSLFAYGSPWNGKHNLSSNCRQPLKAICFIKQSKDNAISEISMDEAVGMLLQQCFKPSNIEAMNKTINILNSFDKYVRFYTMECNMDISAAEMSYKYMSERI